MVRRKTIKRHRKHAKKGTHSKKTKHSRHTKHSRNAKKTTHNKKKPKHTKKSRYSHKRKHKTHKGGNALQPPPFVPPGGAYKPGSNSADGGYYYSLAMPEFHAPNGTAKN